MSRFLSKEVDFAKGSCAYKILLNLWQNQDHLVFQGRSRPFSERRRRRIWRIRPILGLDVCGTFTVYLARVELVKLSEMLISPGAPAFPRHVIPAPSLHRASTDALIPLKYNTSLKLGST